MNLFEKKNELWSEYILNCDVIFGIFERKVVLHPVSERSLILSFDSFNYLCMHLRIALEPK